MSSRLSFKLQAKDPWSEARACEFKTAHGVVQTPIFMPVATQAVLRGVDITVTESLNYPVLLANTYHLLLRPGIDIFKQFKGIHNFMKWRGSVLTDSGGFQIFSLSQQLQMSEEGAKFRSYVDGSTIVLTPERSIEMQRAIGSDIMMVLDHCIDSTSDQATTRKALELTTRWAKRSFDARGDSPQALFGIVQGACFKHLRKESADAITQIPFDGFALGGLAVGETKAEREDMVEFSAPLLPPDKPRYLMGVGTPIDLLEAVKRGMDMFDCILPTSLAHQGVCFTSKGKVDLRRGVYKNSEQPLDPACQCSTCARFSRAYLSHLIRAQEFVADQLLSTHNLTFYRALVDGMRSNILAGTFKEFYNQQRPILMAGDDENPPVQPKARHYRVPTLGDYEIVEHPAGYGSIKQISSGEVMHPVRDPCDEAKELYIDQSEIVTSSQSEGEPLVVWDVGLGAATNAMVSILALEAVTLKRMVTIFSFERDLNPLRLALKDPTRFKHLRHAAPTHLLRDGRWESKVAPIAWFLREGDFSERMNEAESPDIIWFDPFSFKVNPELWNVESFKQLLAVCGKKPASLYTYTASTAVRASMLAAGWYVGAGKGSGPKSETTCAFTPAAAAELKLKELPANPLLGADWLSRWRRSDSRRPLGDSDGRLEELVSNHPQFG